MKEYTQEFYRFNIREGYLEDNPKRVARYINGLICDTQDEMNLLSPNFVEEAYHFSLKVEEKLARKIHRKSQGPFKGRGPMRDRGKPAEASSSNQPE